MFARLNKTYKELGPTNTLVHICNRVLASLFLKQVIIYKYYITKQSVTSSLLISSGKGKNIEVSEIGSRDPICSQLDRPSKVIQARFNQGGHCYAAFRKGEIAGYLWLNFGKYQEDEVRCTFVLSPFNKSAWDYDVYVFPKHRFSFAFPRLWEYANEVMTARGIQNTYSRIAYYNIASLNSHKKLGSQIIGSIYFLQFFHMQLSLSFSFRPAITFSRNRQTLPDIYIS
ncbi:MAG: hypothetical protein WA435_01120 [Gallionellaceae bacterium]